MAIYPNDSKTFSVWLATVSSANFSSKGFIACSRQVIHTINSTAAGESSQDPGYEWFHTLLSTNMLNALPGKHGAQGPHLEHPFSRPGGLILTLFCGSEKGIAWIGEGGPHVPWFTYVHAYMCQHAHKSCSSSVHQHGPHTLSCCDKTKTPDICCVLNKTGILSPVNRINLSLIPTTTGLGQYKYLQFSWSHHPAFLNITYLKPVLHF